VSKSKSVYHNRLLWTREEELRLVHAFIVLDLEEDDLYKWCQNHEIIRTPEAIKSRLSLLGFLPTKDLRKKKKDLATLLRGRSPKSRYADVERELAEINLKNEIALAKLECATASIYRPTDEQLGLPSRPRPLKRLRYPPTGPMRARTHCKELNDGN
jgi:hypothetical protein